MKFQAQSVEYWSQDGVETVLFGHAEKELALLMSNVPGTSDHYLEWNDQSNACTNAVKTIQLSGQELQVQLLPEAAKLLGASELIVAFDVSEKDFTEISRGLNLIFGDKLAFKNTGVPKKAAPRQDYSQVKYLNLEGKNLRTLPDYVREMSSLVTAKLARNPHLDFHATCEVLAKLPNLKELTFTTEQAVPANIGQLSALESLSLDGFSSPQTLPDSIGQLTRLKYLLLMSDSEVILPESFADLVHLEALNMRAASWQLPSKFYRLNKIKQLDFSNCRFTQVPEEMAGMTEVDTLIFGSPEERNYAQILSVVAKMPNLKVLEMNVNPVPREIGRCRQIEELIIWTGFGSNTPLQIPDELFELQQLKSLILSLNRFDKIPAGIGKLKGLEQLVFIEADFESLPESVGELSNLNYLNISENPSLRSLPESLGNLQNLKKLYLADNPQLTHLPDGLEKLIHLEEVQIPNRETLSNIPESWNSLFI